MTIGYTKVTRRKYRFSERLSGLITVTSRPFAPSFKWMVGAIPKKVSMPRRQKTT